MRPSSGSSAVVAVVAAAVAADSAAVAAASPAVAVVVIAAAVVDAVATAAVVAAVTTAAAVVAATAAVVVVKVTAVVGVVVVAAAAAVAAAAIAGSRRSLDVDLTALVADAMARRLGSVCQIGSDAVFLARGAESRQHSGMRSPVLVVARRWLLGVFGAVSVAVLAGRAHADPDSLNNLLGPREIAVGEAMRGGATGASGAELNPSGVPLNRELVFEGGYGYRPDDSASLIGVSACDSTNAMPGCFFYNYAGTNPELGDMTMHRTTHVGGVTLSRVLLPRLLVGATTKYYHFTSNMTGESNASGTTFDLGATIRVTSMINLGVSGQNLWATTSSPEFPRALGGGVYARPLPVLALSFDSRWKLEGPDRSARYGGGAELFLRSGDAGYPIRVGALHDNGLGATYLSAGLGYASMGWGLDVTGRREVKGGDDTMFIASMRLFGPRMPAPAVE